MIEDFSEEEIEQYLNGESTDDLYNRIENAIVNDNEFAQIINTKKLLYNTAKRELYRNDISKIHNQLKSEGFFEKIYDGIDQKKLIPKSYIKFLMPLIAASVLGLSVLLYFMFFNRKDLFNEYYTVLPDKISIDIKLIAESRSDSSIDETYFNLMEAMKEYNNNKFSEALKLLEDCSNRNDIRFNKYFIQLYMGSCQLQLKNYQSANDIFKNIISDKNFELHEDALWYLSLSSLKIGQIESSKKHLKELLKSEKYSKNAAALLNKIK